MEHNLYLYPRSVQVKVKLYSNFVRSGTLTGGVMDEQEEGAAGGDFVEDTVGIVSSSSDSYTTSFHHLYTTISL